MSRGIQLVLAVFTAASVLLAPSGPATAQPAVHTDFELPPPPEEEPADPDDPDAPDEPVDPPPEPEWLPWSEYIDVRTDHDRTSQVRGYHGLGGRVIIPAGTHRGTGGLARLDPAAEDAWFRYYLRLDSWTATSSGKLPGLSGLYGSSARGCIPSTESNPGWSARTMFEGTGTHGAPDTEVRLGTYLYHLDQQGTCGDEILWQPGILEQGRWYCIEGHVRMNTPGVADGVVEAWVDGVPALRWPDVALRRADEPDIGVRQFWANIYFGGSVVNPLDLTASVDEIFVSTENRVGCIDPFTDDEGSPFEPELEELYARGVMFGCEDRLACPERALTRAEMAALLHRALGLGNGPDAFTDDDGHWAEQSINALAGAGLTRGCTATSYCPDQVITRAEMAVFLVRGFDLGAGGDTFTDADGHWAELEIEALAASGITKGCGDGEFCPDSNLRRDHNAAFLRRALGFSLGPEAIGLAGEQPLGDQRLGELVPGSFDDHDEPVPELG